MRFALTDPGSLAGAGFDAIIDARSPAEFDEDHLPGAINLAVLDDAERAEVGTIYVQQSRFLARRLGASLVAANIARHLTAPPLSLAGPRFRPLVYCWRGGQRSGAFAAVLGQIGWQVATLEGGWRAWRRAVVATLYDRPCPAPVVVLDGNTGTAKTALLARVAKRGVQVIDLEGLARHRGSLFGARPGGQPAQKAFESALAVQVAALDPTRPVLVEAESNKVGDRLIPPILWQAMCAAPRIAISAPLPARAAYLAQAYADIAADTAGLEATIAALQPFHPRDRIARWQQMAAQGAHAALAAELMAQHYDPRYARQRARHATEATVLETETLDPDALDRIADRIAAALPALAPA